MHDEHSGNSVRMTPTQWLCDTSRLLPRTHAHTHTRQVRRGDPRTIRTAGIPACSPIKLSYLCTRLLVIWRRECGRWYVCQQSVSTRRQRQSMDVADSRYYSHQYECMYICCPRGEGDVTVFSTTWKCVCSFVNWFMTSSAHTNILHVRERDAEVTWRITFVQNYAHRLSCRRVDKSKSVFLSNLGKILFHTGWLTGSWQFYFGKML